MTAAPTLDASRAEAVAAPAPPAGAGSPLLRRYGPPAAAVAAYAAVACLAFWPVEPFSSSRLSSCACSDVAQETWFLAYTAHALRAGVNPFFTTLLNHPAGVNLALNTSMPLLGALGAPLTWLRGPVATFNALMRLSFVLSATSMLFVVHRLARWWPAAFLAGLLYGFSPFMVGQGFGHLFLTFVPLPPLVLLCGYELVVRPAERPLGREALRRGVLLGLLCVAQYLISIEVLVATGIGALVVAVVAGLRRPRAALRRLRAAAGALAAALAALAALVAYPTWYFLQGPQHVVGPPHPVANLAPLKADLLGFVVPTLDQRIGTAHLMAIGTGFTGGDRPENGVYLGIPLLLLVAYLVVRFRRDDRVMLGGLLAAVGALLALGTPLVVDGHPTGVPLPFAVLSHLPLLKGITAIRFELLEQLGVALVLGVGLARLRDLPPAPASPALARPHPWRAGLVGAAGAVALLPLLPRYPYPSARVDLPTWVTTDAVDAVPPGGVVLTYPWDVDPVNEAMLWQAASGMRFAIFGGQASRPGPGGGATSAVATLDPPVVQQLFAAGLYGDEPHLGAPLPPEDPATLAAIAGFCRRYGVQAVVVDPRRGARPAAVVRYLTAALGAAPRAIGGVDVWTDVPALPARAGGATP